MSQLLAGFKSTRIKTSGAEIVVSPRAGCKPKA
jgi:hypothetical protein